MANVDGKRGWQTWMANVDGKRGWQTKAARLKTGETFLEGLL